MATNPMQRKVRNSFILGILVMLIIVVLIGSIVFFMVIKPKMDEKKEEEKHLVTYAYRLKAGMYVESAQEIDATMVESVEIPVETETTDFIQAKYEDENGNLIDSPFPFGYKSKIALAEGTILTYSMLYEEEETPDSLRLVEYNMITIPTSLDIGNYVDIRLRLPNGQDLIVVSKKEIVNIYGQTISLNLEENEIVILNSAIVEAYTAKGSEIYMSTYVEPGLQEAAVNTYMPTAEVIALINADENIVNTAKQALANLYTKPGTITIREQLNNQMTQYSADSKTNVEEGMLEQIEAAKQARQEYLYGLEEE